MTKRKFKIKLSTKASKDLRKFRKRYWKSYRDFLKSIVKLECSPFSTGKALKGELKGLYSLHFSRNPECRAIYEIKEHLKIVIILHIDTRENIY